MQSEQVEQLLAVPDEFRCAAVARTRQIDVDQARLAFLLARQDQDPVGEIDRLLEIVGDENGRHILVAPDPGEFLLHADLGHRIERAERFVEQQDFRLHGKRPGDADALCHAAGQLPGIGRLELLQADELDVVTRTRPRLLTRQPSRFQPEGDVVEHRQPGKKARLLEDDGAFRADAADRLAVDEHITGVGIVETGQNPKQGRLARTAGADDRKALAGADVEIDIFQNLQAPAVQLVGFREVTDRHLPAADVWGDAHHNFLSCLPAWRRPQR
ncbi:hypothetical protein RHECNPAF_1360040 [Rhizobium etli CNPAF512]|nr:hypothetical protein RHECNPAF_1360040 [Rhizobium etli CNPAF512]